MTIADLKSIISDDLGLPPDSLTLKYMGTELANESEISQTPIEDNAMLTAERKRAAPPPPRPAPQARPPQSQGPTGQAGPGVPGVEEMRQQALSNPAVLEQMRSTWPDLAAAVHDPPRFAQLFQRAWQERQSERERLEREFEFMDANPTAENQAKILEQIRLQQVEENRQAAIENLPMAFGSVTMLYIPVKVGRIEIKAFVDSGAQTTIMSPDCAERCGITHLIDKRYSGLAKGVGTAKIVGRVHIANLTIGGQYLPCSFTVIENQSLDFLLGLDMLKRHRASIDLAKNVLRIPGSEEGQSDTEVPFLGESEIPKRDLEDMQPTAEQPAGAKPGPSVPPPAPPAAGSSASAGGSAGAGAGPSPAGSQPARAAAAPAGPPGQPGSDQVRQLVEIFGCSEQEAIGALRSAGGNFEIAANLLSGF